MQKNARPIADSYWVIPGRLLAGRRPAPTEEEAAAYLVAGITHFVDLTFEGELGLASYVPIFAQEAADRGCRFTHRRFPIVDRSVPGIDEMKEILSEIDRALGDGEVVYVHCFGGIGRTGTTVGCHLVRHGVPANVALRRLIELRQGIPSDFVASPETDEQRAFVRSWQEP